MDKKEIDKRGKGEPVSKMISAEELKVVEELKRLHEEERE
jgi:hypothetical protein